MPGFLQAAGNAIANAGNAVVQACQGNPLAPKSPSVVIHAPKIVLCRKTYQNEGDRLRVRIGATGGFAGTGTLTGPASIRLFDAHGTAVPLPYANIPGADLSGGITLFIEGVTPSAAMADIALTLTLAGGPAPLAANPATDNMTCVELTLELCAYKPQTGGADPAPMGGDTRVTAGRNIHVQTDRLYAGRALLIVRQAVPAAYAGNVVLREKSGRLRVFDYASEIAAAGQVKQPLPLSTANGAIPAAGLKLWVEGAKVSDGLLDAVFQLEISDLPRQEGDCAKLTVIKTKLHLCQSRRSLNEVTDPIKGDKKMTTGRYLHVQDAGNHHGRARVLIRQVKPVAYAGTVNVVVWDATADSDAAPRARLFAAELPGGAGALAQPHPLVCPAAVPAAGLELWAEGATVSAALVDTQLRIKVADAEGWGDKAALTVCQLSNMVADIPATGSPVARAGMAAPARHNWTIANPAPGQNDFDEDYVTNPPLVLMENSIRNSDRIMLSVVVAPVGVPVRWRALRDRRPAPNGDHRDVIGLTFNKEQPSLETSGEGLTNRLLADAVGSFHVCAYIDCNGSHAFHYMTDAGVRIDREPFLMMNMVLVRVKAVQNDSVGRPTQCNPIWTGMPHDANNFGGFTTSNAGGGGWTGPTSGWHASAKVDVIGGGADGRRGLDKVFGGWIQHIFLNDIVNTYEIAPGNLRTHKFMFASNLPNANNPGRYHFIGAAEAAVNPGDAAFCISANAPVIDAGAILDVTPYPDSGTGGDSAVGSAGFQGGAVAQHGGYPAPVVRTMGERWTRDMWDAPGIGCAQGHISAGGNLVRFKFHLGFRTDLCFWTNVNQVPNVDLAPTAVANRLYVSVYKCKWTPKYEIKFDPVSGAATVVTSKKVKVSSEQSKFDGTGRPFSHLETRAPLALSWYAVDART
jgi:hypothetical protein